MCLLLLSERRRERVLGAQAEVLVAGGHLQPPDEPAGDVGDLAVVPDDEGEDRPVDQRHGDPPRLGPDGLGGYEHLDAERGGRHEGEHRDDVAEVGGKEHLLQHGYSSGEMGKTERPCTTCLANRRNPVGYDDSVEQAGHGLLIEQSGSPHLSWQVRY
ncbi:MAG: hypothetical protein UY72_C0001G0025 [Candidatus Uhrbacteria bacterium GW2011_GWD2_52_7]|uniref:Uncharacterized protein n=1 Tax=Candidatus Uhrbacteria bacterium GW2011_GWD2_52_7 TaxID=1618989 RepID=A0A0G1XI36_9BACT|nr:MAG: hypothetical protein UY72_C0001G0025 [Candidatus Uhrbacteria bacterium GW2011_GWD2_52_7]